MAESKNSTTRRDRILRVVLVISLALNLLVLGAVAAGVMKGAQMHRSGHTTDLRALWLALPEEARRDMRQPEGPRNPERHASQREERRARAAERQEALLALLRAPEFDAQAFSDILVSEHDERSERIARAHQAFVARVSELDAAERAAVADQLAEGQMQRSRRR